MNFSISTRNIPPYKVNQPSSHPNNNKNLFPFSADIRCKISLKILKISVFSMKKRNRKKQTNYRSAYQPLPLLLHQPHPLHPQRFFFLLQSKESKLLLLKGKSRPSALSPTEDKPTHNGFTPLLEHKGGKHTAGLRPLSGGRKEREIKKKRRE